MKLSTFARPQRKQWNSRKTSISTSLIMLKALTVWVTTNCGKFLKRWEYQTILPVSWETYMQVKKQQLELDMEQRTGSKLGKEYEKAIYCHSAYLNHMQSTSREMTGWRNHKLNSRLSQAGIKIARIHINNLRYADDTTLMSGSEEELKSLLLRVKRGSEKSCLKTQHSKN